MREYDSTFHMSTHISIFSIFHSVEMVLGASKANRAKGRSMERHVLLHEAWVGEIVHELGRSFWGINHSTSYVSCIEEALE